MQSLAMTTLAKALLPVVLCLLLPLRDGLALGQVRYVQQARGQGSFPIVQGKLAAAVYVDSRDHAGVVRAVSDLQADVARVTGCTPAITHEENGLGTNAIIGRAHV